MPLVGSTATILFSIAHAKKARIDLIKLFAGVWRCGAALAGSSNNLGRDLAQQNVTGEPAGLLCFARPPAGKTVSALPPRGDSQSAAHAELLRYRSSAHARVCGFAARAAGSAPSRAARYSAPEPRQAVLGS